MYQSVRKIPHILIIASILSLLVSCAEPDEQPISQPDALAQPAAQVITATVSPSSTAPLPMSLPQSTETSLPPSPSATPTEASPTPTMVTPTSTRTPRPPTVTNTPAPTLPPLTQDAIASCPVSLPNLTTSPNTYYISTRSGYGNPERNMFIGLWPEGKVIFHPDGPGQIFEDGSLGMKFWFYRTIPGDVIFSGERLDAPSPPMPEVILRGEEDGYGEVGFHPLGLVFPGEGCWRVYATIGDSRMTFVTVVDKREEMP